MKCKEAVRITSAMESFVPDEVKEELIELEAKYVSLFTSDSVKGSSQTRKCISERFCIAAMSIWPNRKSKS